MATMFLLRWLHGQTQQPAIRRTSRPKQTVASGIKNSWRSTMKRIFAALFALVCAASASAAPFQNGGFEVGTLTADPCNNALPTGSTAVTGWTVISGNIEYLDAP